MLGTHSVRPCALLLNQLSTEAGKHQINEEINEKMMEIHFLRHATLIIRFGGRTLLVDPMLSRAEAMDPIQNAAVLRRIPMIELPLDGDELEKQLSRIDAVLVTHTHRDHWDATAVGLLAKRIPVLCQPADETRLKQDGFVAVQPVEREFFWKGIQIERTDGQHGTGEVGRQMGPVSGFVLRVAGEPTLYIAGDTVWCDDVEDVLNFHEPDVVIVNAGAAQFLTGDPITMTTEDVLRVVQEGPGAIVVAVHMEAINHCGLTRAALAGALAEAGVEDRVQIPLEGDRLQF